MGLRLVTAPITFARGFTTGAQLLAAIEQRAAERGVPLKDYVRALNTDPRKFIMVMRRSKGPIGLTFDRVEALLNGKPIPPAQRKPRTLTQPVERGPVGPVPDPIDRDPCRYCGIRADIGCKHQRAAR